jgi:hypothetical protein
MIRNKLLVAGCRLLVVLFLGLHAPRGGGMENNVIPELSDAGVAQSQIDVLVGFYSDAQKRIREMVLHPKGMTQSAQEFRQARAAQQIAQIQTLLSGLGRETNAWVSKAVPQAFKDGIALANKQAREAGVGDRVSGIQGSFSLIDSGALRVIAHDIAADLNKAASSLGQTAGKILRQTAQIGLDEKKIDTIIAGGIIEGTPRETIRSLRDELVKVHEGGLVKVIDKNGDPIIYDARDYASMVVRTKTRQATVVARHQRLQQLDLDLVAIIGRISKYFCTAYLGEVYSLSGKSTKYPAYSSLPGGGPPFHPNCSKSTRPFIEELASDQQLANAEGGDDQEKMLDISPADAQRRFKDLQIESPVKARYGTTEKKLFG